MKIADLFEKSKKGTYSAVHFSNATVQALAKYAKENNVPNPLRSHKFHTTVLFSRKFLPNYHPIGKYEVPMLGTFEKFEIWPNSSDKEKKTNCLVFTYSCPELEARHKFLMKEHGATYDYPEYHPHITLSYDIGDFDIATLPPFTKEIEVETEYGEDLDLTWDGN